MPRRLLAIFLLLLTNQVEAAPRLIPRVSGSVAPQPRANTTPWWRSLQHAILSIQRSGPGGYSTEDYAKEALVNAFQWDEQTRRLRFTPGTARPSFCSAAVYAALLSALLHWEECNQRRYISAKAWQALLPRLVKDGIGPWGYANANGPGFALLVHQLGAGINFTDWEKARPSDIAKIWWNDHIGADERGHLVILVQDDGANIRFWSANQARDNSPGGYGIRSVPKSAIRRILFTRITHPAAFNRASALPDSPWLTSLIQSNTTWEECIRRCGIR